MESTSRVKEAAKERSDIPQQKNLNAPLGFFPPPLYSLSWCQTFLAPHFRTDWLTRLGLGNQAGSTTDHLKLLTTQHTKRSKYEKGRADIVIANRVCWNFGTHKVRSSWEITQTGLVRIYLQVGNHIWQVFRYFKRNQGHCYFLTFNWTGHFHSPWSWRWDAPRWRCCSARWSWKSFESFRVLQCWKSLWK